MLKRPNNNGDGYDIFEERDSGGEVKKEIRPGLGKIKGICRLKESDFYLQGFEGRAKTSTGAVGEFYIRLKEVRSIVIK